MITTLLWRCPACGTDDALRSQKGLFQPERLRCVQCNTEWQVRRVIGDDYRLRVVRGNDGLREKEMTLTEWYDLMKASLALVPRVDGSLALNEGETLYLRCDQSQLIVSAHNPLRNHWASREAPLGPASDELSAKWGPVGKGTLWMTNQRLVWESPLLSVDFPWRRVQSVFTFHTMYYGIMFGATTYRFTTPKQSILKWLTYTGKIAEVIRAGGGRNISLSYY